MVKKNPIRFLFQGLTLDERTREYIEKRLSPISKLLEKILIIEVEIGLNKKGEFRSEIMVRTPYRLYRAEETTESVEGSVDIAVAQLRGQIKKDKGRERTLRRRGRISLKKKTVLDGQARF
jgi:ribosomal subunit interface protein